MKKIYSLILLAMLFVAGTCAVQAQKRWRVTDIEQTLSTDELDGVQFAINNGSVGGGSNDFIRGTEKSTTLTDENLYVLEETGNKTTEDRTVYRLKRVVDNTYLENKDGKVSYTETASRGWTFYIMEAITVTEDELKADPATITDFRNVTTNSTYGNSLVFVDASQEGEGAKDATYRLCSNGTSINPSFSKTNYATDFFNLYAVEEATGYAYLEDAMTEIFNGAVPTDLYNPGDQPGNISQELYDELTGAYDEAQELINNMSEDHAACVASAERCAKAYKAAQEGVILVQAGYYYFRSARSENSVTYEDGANMRWVEDWTEKEELAADDCKYIWQLIENPARRGSYFIRNLYSQRYCGYASALYTLIPTTEEAEESFLIYPLDKDYFVIQSTSLLQKGGASGYNGYDCLHAQVNGHSMVIWAGTEDSKQGSGWKFLHVDQSKIDAVMNLIEQAKLNEKLQAELDDATADYQNGFTYSFDGNLSGKLDNEDDGTPKGLVTSLDQITTNAQEPSEGPFDNILDSNIGNGNFWHSSWSTDNFDHTNNYPFLQFDLKKAVNEVSIKMWSRLNNGNYYTSNLPGKLHILATNDPEGEWTEIGTFENKLKWPAVTVENGVETTGTSNTVSLVRIPFGETFVVGLRVDHHIERLMLQGYLYVAPREEGVAIAVGSPFAVAMNDEAAGLKRFHMAVFRQGSLEELQSHLRSINGIERFHHHHIKESVAHAGMRGNESIVAVLRSIGTGNEESLAFGLVRVALYGIGLGFVEKSFTQRVFHISDQATTTALSELLAHKGIEAHTAGTKERTVVDGTIVELFHVGFIDDAYGFAHIKRDMEMACQSVARTARHHGKRRGGMNQCTRHLVDRAVAAHGHHHIHAALHCIGGKHRSVARIRGVADFHIVAVLVRQFFSETGYTLLALRAGNGVYEIKYAFLHCSGYQEF